MNKSDLKSVRLPAKPSKLIRLALDDLDAVESEPDKYVVDMDTWHGNLRKSADKGQDPVCHVCLAGSVIAKTMKARRNWNISPTDITCMSRLTKSRLAALDCFRVGEVETGLKLMGCTLPTAMLATCNVVEYSQNPASFKDSMNDLADHLERYGL
jgi:hypothetical protein